ncbi:MAG: hypothetical protein AAB552_00905 [Patescibacteria group bacterium]
MVISICGKEDYSLIVEEFKHKHGIHKIVAFSGGASTSLSGISKDDPLQNEYEKIVQNVETKIIGEAIGLLRDYRIAVLTGGTKWGVPFIASRKAKEYGLKTIGVYPLVGKKHALGEEHLDLSFCVGPLVGQSNWGDESPIFANLLDGVIVCAGGAGTLTECAHILKINEHLLKSGNPLKYLVPIAGTGGVADFLQIISSNPDLRSRCMPNKRVVSGLHAAEILREELELEDYLI